MQGGPGKFVIVILLVFILIDLYTFRGLRSIALEWNSTLKIALSIVYWLVPVFMVVMSFVIGKSMSKEFSGEQYYKTFFTFMGVMVLFYAPKLIFVAFELGNDMASAVVFLINKFSLSIEISNMQRLRYVGAVLSFLLFVFTAYGMAHGKYHYKVNRVSISNSKIPEAFNGYKIVHISDWHIGSFYGKPKRIEDAVNRINALEPDLILFTGDMVNNVADEVPEFLPQLQQLKAKYGIYSVLGNHDYGEYVRWKNKEEAADNLSRLKQLEEEAGFILLNNQSVYLHKDGEKIGLAGVENWGLPPFPQYGNLDSALANITEAPYTILMSHDPSHWEAEVTKKSRVDLTLSGHTHGMQFGINLKNMKWSPVKLKYPRWAGLYTADNQSLFVSVGIGYIGFPGRVGMRPEIALITLQN